MQCYTQQHTASCGIALHARSLDVCILPHAGESMVHHNVKTSPETCRKGIAPYRDAVVVAVAGIFPWDWLADLGTREGLAFVLGPALDMKALHGGKATHDTIAAQNSAGRLRGGMRPQAAGSPAARRATRALLRRRMHCMRKRAALLTHVQPTNSQDNRPEMGRTMAEKANRVGVAERVPEPAVPKSIAVALALRGHDDDRRRDGECAILRTATQPTAPTRSLCRTVPGIGARLRLVLLYALHDSARCPRGQGLRLVWPAGSVGAGGCRQALRDSRGNTRQRGPPRGVLGSGRALVADQASGPEGSRPLGDNPGPGPGLARCGPSAGPGGLFPTQTRGGLRSPNVLPRRREGRR
jgi:hypothetical protein